MWYLGSVLCLFNVLFLTTASNEVDLCHPASCVDNKNDVTFTELCHQHRGEVTGKCCMRQGNVAVGQELQIIGIDLRSCDSHKLVMLGPAQNVSSDSAGDIRSHIEILMLSDTAWKECDTAVFEGMTQLNYLSLPAKCGCPGGTNAWESSTVQHSIKTCRNKTDICVTQNVTCPKHSHCVVHSPGVTWCTCDEDHYGYKCLRQGAFPTAVFTVSMAGCVVVLSAILWATIRRRVQ